MLIKSRTCHFDEDSYSRDKGRPSGRDMVRTWLRLWTSGLGWVEDVAGGRVVWGAVWLGGRGQGG